MCVCECTDLVPTGYEPLRRRCHVIAVVIVRSVGESVIVGFQSQYKFNGMREEWPNWKEKMLAYFSAAEMREVIDDPSRRRRRRSRPCWRRATDKPLALALLRAATVPTQWKSKTT